MPVYEYVALDARGRKRAGIVDAESPTAARQKLREDGVFPTQVRESSQAAATSPSQRQSSFSGLFSRVGAKQLSIMTRQLSTLMGAGLPLVTALNILVPQTGHPKLQRVMAHVKDAIVEGNSLADALAMHPKVFPPLYLNMVRAGEASGAMELVLQRLADLAERQQQARSRVRKALVYPAFMTVFGAVILTVLLVFVVPSITTLFAQVNRVLPLPTRMLLGFSGFLRGWWWVMLLLLVAAVFFLLRMRRTDRGSLAMDRMMLAAPIWGGIALKLIVARFSRTLSSLLSNGVPMMASLEIVRAVAENRVVADALSTISAKVGEGSGLAKALAAENIFPEVAVQMIEVGEQSGEMENMLDKVADLYQGEAEEAIDSLTTLLEPFMILVMAAVVGFIVLAVLLPIAEMSSLAT
ncbi:MAG: type II secretion system inner membrane protein GspF [Thermodesulfobacteriota bacterium]